MAVRLIRRASRLLAVPLSFKPPPVSLASECVRLGQLAPPCLAALHTSPPRRLQDSLQDRLQEVSQPLGADENGEFQLMLKALPGVEELLEVSRQPGITINRSVLVIQQIAIHQGQCNSESLRNDPRFLQLLENVNKKIQYIWNTRLTSLLRSLYRLGFPRNDHYLQSVEIEVRWRLRKLTIGNLDYLARSLPAVSRFKDDKSLHSDLLKEVELRWTEIRETRTLVSLMLRLGSMSDSLMEKLEDKILEFAEHLTPEEIRHIICSLASQNRRTLSILRALSFYLLQNKLEFSPPLILDLAYAFSNLNFCNTEVLQKFVTDIMPKLSQLKPIEIARFLRSMALLRFPNQLLCEAIVQECLVRGESFGASHLCSVLQGFAYLNFQPSRGDEFFSLIHKSLANLDSQSWQMLLDAVWSLCVLERVIPSYFQIILMPQFYNKVLEDRSMVSVSHYVKLLNVNAAAKLESPGYEGPLLPDHVLQLILDRAASGQHSKFGEMLKAIFPDEATRNIFVFTVYGFLLDGEVILDSSLTAWPLKDFAAPLSLHSEGTKPLPENLRRVAIVVRKFSHHLIRGKDMLGKYAMTRRHLQAAGYLVLEVPYYEWQEIKSDAQKLIFLREQIRKVMTQEMVP